MPAYLACLCPFQPRCAVRWGQGQASPHCQLPLLSLLQPLESTPVPQPELALLCGGGHFLEVPTLPVPWGACGAGCAPASTPVHSVNLVLLEYRPTSRNWDTKVLVKHAAPFPSMNTEASRASKNLIPLACLWKYPQKKWCTEEVFWDTYIVHFSCLLRARWEPTVHGNLYWIGAATLTPVNYVAHHYGGRQRGLSFSHCFPGLNVNVSLVSSLFRCANAVCYPLGNCQVPLWRWGVGLVLIFIAISFVLYVCTSRSLFAFCSVWFALAMCWKLT